MADARFDMTLVSAQARRFAPILVMIAVALVIAGLLAALASSLPARRTGDGEEYYAMQIAWADTHRPFMTEAAWVQYDKLYKSGEIARFDRSMENLKSMFPNLILGQTADFNHFWMYSALAAGLQEGAGLVGVDLTRHQSFLLLHALLFVCVLFLAFRWQGVAGAMAWLVLAVGSPFLWYFNKVHTEFFTASLTVLAMAAAMKHRWAVAGLALALTSTQNISFLLPAFFACLVALTGGLGATPRLRPAEACMLALAALLALVHPAYYFFRHGALTPQLLAGGAQVDNVNPLVAFNFLFDLDVGLFPNWPLGMVIALVGLVAIIRRRPEGIALLAAFAVLYAATALYAQSATSNVNSGATVHVARYGLWYVCLLYPLLVWAWAMLAQARRTSIAMAALLGLALVLVNYARFNPVNAEVYVTHTPAAKWVYSTFPSLYEPNQEIFRERSTMVEGDYPRPSIVLGPGCRMGLVLVGDNQRPPQILGRDHCDMHVPSLIALLQQRGTWTSRQEDHYVTLSERDIASLFGSTPRGSVLHAAAPAKALNGYLGSGWSDAEPWGVWSNGPLAKIAFSVRGARDQDLKITLVMQAFVPTAQSRMVVVPVINGKAHPSWVFRNGDPMPVRHTLVISGRDLEQAGGRVRLEMTIREPTSPQEAGISNDSRELGIGLITMEVQ